jgi:hypothetical protein
MSTNDDAFSVTYMRVSQLLEPPDSSRSVEKAKEHSLAGSEPAPKVESGSDDVTVANAFAGAGFESATSVDGVDIKQEPGIEPWGGPNMHADTGTRRMTSGHPGGRWTVQPTSGDPRDSSFGRTDRDESSASGSNGCFKRED